MSSKKRKYIIKEGDHMMRNKLLISKKIRVKK